MNPLAETAGAATALSDPDPRPRDLPRRAALAVVPSRPRPARSLSMRDAARAVADACLADLPEKYRTLVWVVDVEGMPLAEASRHLATGEALLGARLHRARQMLARALCRRCQPRA